MEQRKQSLASKKAAATKQKNKEELDAQLAAWRLSSRDYINFHLLNKNKAKIIFVISDRGVGKTTMAIFEAMKSWKKTGHSSVLLRRSFEEIKDLAHSEFRKYDTKIYPQVLGKNIIVNKGGIWKESKKIAGPYKQKGFAPVIQFAAISQAAKRTSISYPETETIHYIIDDEITNASHGQIRPKDVRDHFQTYETISRGKDPFKLLIFLNKNFEIDSLWDFFGLMKEYKSQPEGTIRRYKKQINIINRSVNSHVAIYKLKHTTTLQETYSKSEIVRFGQSAIGYANFLLGGKALVPNLKFNEITKLYNFAFILILNGENIGVWYSPEKEILQFSQKYNPNGKKYYLYYEDYAAGSIRGNEVFMNRIYNHLKSDKIEFANLYIRNEIIDMLKSKWENN